MARLLLLSSPEINQLRACPNNRPGEDFYTLDIPD
jgi:hypothetical protein